METLSPTDTAATQVADGIKSVEQGTKQTLTLTLQPAPFVRYLALTTVLLLVLNVLVILRYTYVTTEDSFFSVMFNFDMENNVSSYFSTSILLVAALLLGVIAALKRKQQDPFALRWALLSGIFLCLSLDESLALHNRVERLLDPLTDFIQSSSFLSFSWVIAGAAFVGFFVLAYWRFFFALAKPMQLRFFLAGGIYVLGAIGFEMLGAHFFVQEAFNGDNIPYMTVMTIEETLEMVGVIVFIDTLLAYLHAYAKHYIIVLR